MNFHNIALRQRLFLFCLAVFCITACSPPSKKPTGPDVINEQSLAAPRQSCSVELVVLGAGQDAGAPQIGNSQDRGWQTTSLQLLPTSLVLVDQREGKRYMFEASPEITQQVRLMDLALGTNTKGLRLDGVFLTHAHIGHYAGLMYLGREAAGTKGIDVFAMPRMAGFLRDNGPWSQLVSLGNINLHALNERTSHTLTQAVTVTPYRVPHRDEYSETVGYMIKGPTASALFVPDIDSWPEWQADFGVSIEEMIAQVDFAFVDATFFDDNELPGRDMSEIPHPRVVDTMAIFAQTSEDMRSRIHFIHYNHTNPIRDPASDESRKVLDAGFNIARRGDRHCLAK